jgi:hypothetical protein
VPEVRSVIINWFIALVDSIRVASLFFNRQYYLAAAEYGQTTNNIVFVYDETNSWKILRGITAATMGKFFNSSYYGSSLVGKLVKWLDPLVLTDQGTNIELDIRTKAFSSELGNETKTKYPRYLVLGITGTGARITPTYSVDVGKTFLPMSNIMTGLSYYDSVNDGRSYTIRFVPQASSVGSGKTLLYRLYSNDAFAVEVKYLKTKCGISAREVYN